MTELAGDDSDVDSFGAELGGVRMTEAVGVNTFGDSRLCGQAC